jgi:hypothetical protein
MDEKENGTYRRLIDIGLNDPFFRMIAGGVVVLAVAASIAIPLLGSGTKLIVALALLLAFGVVSIILQTLTKYVDSVFVKFICLTSSGVIMFVFLTLMVLLVPAFVGCWPLPYAQLLGVSNCVVALDKSEAPQRPFTPVAFDGKGITRDVENKKYLVWIFYRQERQEDAEHIVGALLSAGYASNGSVSTLDEVFAMDKRPGTTLIKTTTLARPVVGEVSKLVEVAIPVKAQFISILPDDAPLQRGNIQIDLF